MPFEVDIFDIFPPKGGRVGTGSASLQVEIAVHHCGRLHLSSAKAVIATKISIDNEVL